MPDRLPQRAADVGFQCTSVMRLPKVRARTTRLTRTRHPATPKSLRSGVVDVLKMACLMFIWAANPFARAHALRSWPQIADKMRRFDRMPDEEPPDVSVFSALRRVGTGTSLMIGFAVIDMLFVMLVLRELPRSPLLAPSRLERRSRSISSNRRWRRALWGCYSPC